MSSNSLSTYYRQTFQKLKNQVDLLQRQGLKKQTPDTIEAFAHNYLRSLTMLAQIKSMPNGKQDSLPIQRLLIQANVMLYPEKRSTFKEFIVYLWRSLPAQLWRDRGFYAVSFLILAATSFLGFILVRQNFELASVFIPEGLRSAQELEAYLFSTDAQRQMLTAGRDQGVMEKSLFATLLMINNIKVAILCLVSGFIFAIPTFLILIQTGLMLGTLPALFYGKSFIGILAWLLPHGVPEISAIIFSGGAGLKIGLTLLKPHDAGTGAVKKTLQQLTGTIIICIVLLVWAGIVESFVRQSTMSDSARLTIAAFSVIPLILLWVRAWIADHEVIAREARLKR